MATTRTRRVVAAVAAVALIATACGDSGDDTTTDDPTATTAAPTDDGDGGDDDGTTTTTTTPTTTTTTTTTVPESTGPEPLALDAIPDLVVAWGDGTGDPLELAKAIIGFPLDIPVPNGTPHGIGVDLFGGDTADTWEWDWSYEVLATEPMPDIDIRADPPSPGYVALSDFYDPIMEALDYRRTGTTGSDPGDEGGPHSVNHVYTSNAETMIVNGLEAIPEPLFAWADEEQVFGEGVPGYQVDAPFEFAAGEVPVPLLLTIIDELPEFDGASLIDARIISWSRPEGSFDEAYGLRYFDVELEWALTEGGEAAQATVLDGLAGSAFAAGSESFFDPGFLEPEEPRTIGAEWTQNVVFLDRYEGTIAIDDLADPILTVDVRFEPGRVELQPLEE